MSLDEAWRQIRGTAAEKVLLNTHRAGGVALPSVYRQGLDDDASAFHAAARLVQLALAQEDGSMAAEVVLTSEGRALGTRIEKSKIDGPERWDAVQRAMLQFIDREKPGLARDFAGTEVEGVRVSDAEAADAFTFLRDNALVQTKGRGSIRDFRPEVTVRGKYAMHEANIREFVEQRPVGSTTYDNSLTAHVTNSNVGGLMAGQNNVQHNSLTVTSDERSQTLTLIDKVLAGLGDAAEDEPLRAKVNEIKAEAETHNASKSSILTKARDALLIATATEGGRSVIQWIGQMITGLGAS